MGYSTAWDETAPVGSTTLASDIDLVFQNLKRDIRERMNDVVASWTTDPIGLSARARMYHSTNQPISHDTLTLLSWDTKDYDTHGSIWSSGANTKLTIPTGQGGKGAWLVIVAVEWAAGALGRRQFDITKNGTVVATKRSLALSDSSLGNLQELTFPVNSPADADYFEVQVRHTQGSTLSVVAGAAKTWFAILRVI